MTSQLQIGLSMLYREGWSADVSLLALVRHRPKMPERGIEPRALSRTLSVHDVLATEPAVAQPRLHSCR